MKWIQILMMFFLYLGGWPNALSASRIENGDGEVRIKEVAEYNLYFNEDIAGKVDLKIEFQGRLIGSIPCQLRIDWSDLASLKLRSIDCKKFPIGPEAHLVIRVIDDRDTWQGFIRFEQAGLQLLEVACGFEPSTGHVLDCQARPLDDFPFGGGDQPGGGVSNFEYEFKNSAADPAPEFQFLLESLMPEFLPLQESLPFELKREGKSSTPIDFLSLQESLQFRFEPVGQPSTPTDVFQSHF